VKRTSRSGRPARAQWARISGCPSVRDVLVMEKSTKPTCETKTLQAGHVPAAKLSSHTEIFTSASEHGSTWTSGREHSIWAFGASAAPPVGPLLSTELGFGRSFQPNW